MSVLAKRKVLVLGCGALGGALIDCISPYVDVSVVDPFPRVKIKGNIYHSVDVLNERSFDGLIVATKCYDLHQSLLPFKNHISVQRLLFLQNGDPDLTQISRSFRQSSIVRGVTTSAIGISSQKPVFHYKGDFFLAPQGDKSKEAVVWFARLLEDAGLNTIVVSKSSRIVWAKLIFSAAMNPLPVITGQGYDVLIKDQEIWRLVRQAVEEGRLVSKALGIRLAFDPLKLIDRVRKGDLVGIAHRGSISQDVLSGRLTELNFITGALIRHARRLGIKTAALNSIFQMARNAGA